MSLLSTTKTPFHSKPKTKDAHRGHAPIAAKLFPASTVTRRCSLLDENDQAALIRAQRISRPADLLLQQRAVHLDQFARRRIRHRALEQSFVHVQRQLES